MLVGMPGMVRLLHSHRFLLSIDRLREVRDLGFTSSRIPRVVIIIIHIVDVEDVHLCRVIPLLLLFLALFGWNGNLFISLVLGFDLFLDFNILRLSLVNEIIWLRQIWNETSLSAVAKVIVFARRN